ncbi:hypothetical protein [Methylobacterium radiotolerans]|uniref:hypothetical protein n=1 Tax=Methylobacterium radiotolerans TaxID=31998 RepID=UPI001FD8E59E|nr:hypothetical protein [Methylobacterium radiotolerans]
MRGVGGLAAVRGGGVLSCRGVAGGAGGAARRAGRDLLRGAIPRGPVVRTDFASDFLLGLNLVGGVTDGRA